MGTEPGGDAMITRYQRDTGAAALKRQTVPRPQAWRIRQTEVARFAADGQRCETRKCREPGVIVTRRWWRAADVGRVLLAEHLVCERHGVEFAARHHTGVDPAGDVGVRRLGSAERAALLVNARHCDWPACLIAATWIFTESYTVRGEPRADEDLSCDRHARAFAARFHISVAPASGQGDPR
jgi:hypothetical protein